MEAMNVVYQAVVAPYPTSKLQNWNIISKYVTGYGPFLGVESALSIYPKTKP
jgi:hypothetical protein